MGNIDGQSRWFWIELIGFDNQLPDFGVREALDRAGFVPEVVALLFLSPDCVRSQRHGNRSFQADIL